MIKRSPTSHKGQNGRVAIIGGNEKYHGAPIFAALAAEYAGADLIYPIVPKCHIEVTKHASYNFICHSFRGNILTPKDLPLIKKILAHCDSVVIGPGLGSSNETLKALEKLIPNLNIKTTIDASALEMVPILLEKGLKLPKETVLTPHHGEFWPLHEEDSSKEIEKKLKKWAKLTKSVILLKAATDLIVDTKGTVVKNTTGNAGLTVGGTGDALSGLIGTLLAQGLAPFEAAKLGAKVIGKCGDTLLKEKGYCYKTVNVIKKISETLK